jgi:hypothetical protein
LRVRAFDKASASTIFSLLRTLLSTTVSSMSLITPKRARGEGTRTRPTALTEGSSTSATLMRCQPGSSARRSNRTLK